MKPSCQSKTEKEFFQLQCSALDLSQNQLGGIVWSTCCDLLPHNCSSSHHNTCNLVKWLISYMHMHASRYTCLSLLGNGATLCSLHLSMSMTVAGLIWCLQLARNVCYVVYHREIPEPHVVQNSVAVKVKRIAAIVQRLACRLMN